MFTMTLSTIVALFDRETPLYLWDDSRAKEEKLTPYDVARKGHLLVKKVAPCRDKKTTIYLREDREEIKAPSINCCHV